MRVNTNLFREKVKERYLNIVSSCPDDAIAHYEMAKALNAILNALPDITDDNAIYAINNCTSEEASDLWFWVYRQMFSTTIGAVIRDDIEDKHAYLLKLIPSRLGMAFGPDPFKT